MILELRRRCNSTILKPPEGSCLHVIYTFRNCKLNLDLFSKLQHKKLELQNVQIVEQKKELL